MLLKIFFTLLGDLPFNVTIFNTYVRNGSYVSVYFFYSDAGCV